MAKHNQSTADRVREEAKQRRQNKENRTFYTLVIITVIIVAAFFLIRFVSKELSYPPLIYNTSSIEDNWVVIDVDNKVTKRYHHPASYDIPEGYAPGDFSKYSDGIAHDFYLLATDPAAAVGIIYIDAAADLTAADFIQRSVDMRENALNTGSSVVAGEPFTATVAGKEAHCLYLVFTTEQGDYGCLMLGFDTPNDVCVTAILSGSYVTDGNVQTQEQLLAEAEVLLAGLTIVE